MFDSFPWPADPTPHQVAGVAGLASEILDLRESYLNRGLTLGQQYDTLRTDGQSQLQDLHDYLADTVHELYGFSTEDDTLAQVPALNLSIADGPGHARGPGGAGLHGHTHRPSG